MAIALSFFEAALRAEKEGENMNAEESPHTVENGNPGERTPKEATQPIPSPVTDPTNPHGQEPAGGWVANERASERRNSEPGMTDSERKRRKY